MKGVYWQTMTVALPWLAQLVDQLAEDGDVACLIIGPGLVVTFATSAAERMFGAAEGTLSGTTVDQLLPVERRGELKNFEDVLGGGGGRRLRSALRLSDGRRLDVSLTLAPLLDPTGRIVAVGARCEPAPSSAQWVRASLAPGKPSLAPSMRRSMAPAISHAAERPSIPAASSHWGEPRGNHASEQRLSPSRPAGALDEYLGQLESHLRWLEGQLSSPVALVSLDNPRERARALLVVGEARDVTERCRQLLEAEAEVQLEPIPAPPKMPRL